MKKLILLAMLLFAHPAWGQVAAISGNLKDAGAANLTSGNTFARFTLTNFGTNIPRVTSTNVIARITKDFKPDASGNISGTIQQNNSIDPAGTDYEVCLYDSGLKFRCAHFTINAAFNLNNATPNTTAPVVPAPTGDSTYARVDAGNQPFTGAITAPGISTTTLTTGITNNSTLACNTSLAFQYQTIAAAYAALPVSGKVEVCDGHSETMASTLTMNKANSGFVFLGKATITCPTTAIGCINVVAGTHGVFFYGQVPFGGGDITQGARFLYGGTAGVGIQVGASNLTTRMFGWSNVAVDLTGGAIGASTGLYLTNVVFFDIQNFGSVNQSTSVTTTGLTCDGTGNFCGNGRIGNPEIISHKVSILGTGSGGGSCMNAVEISGDQRIDGVIAGSIGVDLECANDNIILSMDVESKATALKLGAGAVGNRGTFRSEANTTDIQALAGSTANRFEVQTVGGVAAVVVSDAGTNNHFSRAIDADYAKVTTPVIQAPTGGNVGLNDNAGTMQAAVVPGGLRIQNFLALGAGAKIEDAASGAQVGLTLKKGSGAGNYTTASTTYVVADSTNLCGSFTIPVGWKLGIQASGSIGTSTAIAAASAALTDNAACSTANAGLLTEAQVDSGAIGATAGFSLSWVIAGDGAVHNVALQVKTAAGADAVLLLNSSATALPTMVFTLLPSN